MTTMRELSHARQRDALLAALHPIADLLQDDTIVEIMLNADGVVWIDRLGRGMSATQIRLQPAEGERMLRHIAASLGRELNDSHPTLSCQLPHYGARVQGSLPPIVSAPVFALRKPASLVFSLADYVSQGVLTERQAQRIEECIKARANILIAGGTGSGKTTFANALLQVLASTGDRVLLVEDTPELRCTAPNKLEFYLTESFSCRDAIKSAMRYRPDRIIVGEIRDGAAALEFLKAANTGHPGSLATLHANGTREALTRICQLCEEVVASIAKEIVAETINVCVHITRDPKARAGRSISGLDRVVGFTPDDGFALEPLAL